MKSDHSINETKWKTKMFCRERSIRLVFVLPRVIFSSNRKNNISITKQWMNIADGAFVIYFICYLTTFWRFHL
ncbi:hypothetical protein GJ496_010719 [Pomphorhynchus laevis]|nr:hypothetical protein GJ496_010719 [Pomphorhynchus laevis]